MTKRLQAPRTKASEYFVPDVLQLAHFQQQEIKVNQWLTTRAAPIIDYQPPQRPESIRTPETPKTKKPSAARRAQHNEETTMQIMVPTRREVSDHWNDKSDTPFLGVKFIDAWGEQVFCPIGLYVKDDVIELGLKAVEWLGQMGVELEPGEADFSDTVSVEDQLARFRDIADKITSLPLPARVLFKPKQSPNKPKLTRNYIERIVPAEGWQKPNGHDDSHYARMRLDPDGGNGMAEPETMTLAEHDRTLEQCNREDTALECFALLSEADKRIVESRQPLHFLGDMMRRAG